MFSLTSMATASYMLRIVREVVNRNPRFARALGDVTFINGSRVDYGNLQVIIRDINTDGSRQSFDYFISTMTGRAILTQVADKEGSFMEYVTETDVTHRTPTAGVYFFTVKSVDEQTNDVVFNIETYKWYEGRIRNAQGTTLGFRPGIDATTVVVTDTTSSTPPTIQASITNIHLLSAVGGIAVHDAHGVALTPIVDYWVEQIQTAVVISETRFGVQQTSIPGNYTSIALVDQDGYVLRPERDYIFLSLTEILLSAWTASGNTISITGIVHADPTIPGNLMGAENTLQITLLPGETLAPGEVFVSTQDGDNIAVTPLPNGTIVLPAPLPPGGWCTYEVRVLVGETTVTGKKNAINKNLLPGLRIAIGDQVVAEDQCAILMSPIETETYHVFGGKPGVTFAMDVKANDPTTANELCKMLLQDVLVDRNESIASDGLTIYEASSSTSGTVRDDSGTAPTYTETLSFTAAADWRVFKPLVTRLRSFSVSVAPYTSGPGRLLPTPRYSCLQMEGFTPGYR